MKETTGLQKLFPWSNPLKKASTLFNANTNCDWKSQYFASWELLDSEHGSSLMEYMKLVEMVEREVPSRYSGLISAYWESETWVIPLRLCLDCFLAEWRNIGSSAAAWIASEKTSRRWSSRFLCSFTAPGRLSVPCCLRRLRNSWQFIFSSLNNTCNSFSSLHCSICLFWSTLSFSMLV